MNLLSLLLLSSCLCLVCERHLKHLAGPPSEFNSLSLPLPSHLAEVQHSATFKVHLSPSSSLSSSKVLKQRVTLPVDSSTEFQFAFFSPVNDVITLSLKDPHGSPVPLQGSSSFFPYGDFEVPGTLCIHVFGREMGREREGKIRVERRDKEGKKEGIEGRGELVLLTFGDMFINPVLGEYILTITTRPLSSKMFETLQNNKEADAYIILWTDTPLALSTSLNTYSLTSGNQVGLVSYLFDSLSPTSDIKKEESKAELSVVLPDGRVFAEPMHDDGLHSDLGCSDGVYGGTIAATQAGTYTLSATFRGTNDEGVEYIRSTTHIVAVVDPTIHLTGSAVGILDPTGDIIKVYLSATTTSHSKYRVYAEVWGEEEEEEKEEEEEEEEEGEEVPIAWIGGMAFVQNDAVELELNLNWIAMAHAKGPLTLKGVVVQDAATFIPIAMAERLAMANKTLEVNKNGTITMEMREGKKPDQRHFSSGDGSVPIALVHGYCAAHNSFQIFNNGDDWTNPRFYLDPKQNLPHDNFAVNISEWASQFGPFSYPGGAAGLHLKNYYFSGLDYVTEGRVLQSIGTPYQGSNGAGSAADLGTIFGMTCGYNFDMTLDGAVLWLSSITPINRAHVYYYTTSYVKNQLFDNCNALTQLLLRKPNDGVSYTKEGKWGERRGKRGVTEVDLAQLPDGQNQGNQERWCHIGGMKYPPQVQNSPRNVLMNDLSARTPTL